MILRVIDFETRGLPPDNAQIVEVATVDLVGLSGEPVEDRRVGPNLLWSRGPMWRSFVNPGMPIPPEASAVHHITDDDVRSAPMLVDLPRLLDGADALVAHEARFERECIKLAGWQPELLEAKWVCTRKCSMLAWPDAPNHKNQCLRYWLNLKLADPALASPHRALGDAYVTAAIARRLLLSYSVDQMIEASANPVMVPRLTFGEHAMKPIDEVPTSYFDWIANKSKGPWDEDVLYTARYHLAQRRAAERTRSPV